MGDEEVDVSEVLAAVDAALADDDPTEAYAQWRRLMSWPGEPIDTPELPTVLEALARVSEALEVENLTGAALAAARAPAEVDVLYDLGYELVELGLPDVAATVLMRAHRAAPQHVEVLTELACALEGNLCYRAMVEVFAAAGEARRASFMCRYFYAFGAAMSGDLALAWRLAPELDPDPEDSGQIAMVRRIGDMVERAALVAEVTPLDETDLRGWHWVTQGSVLLSLSPHGQDEGMNGRWAYTDDSIERCRGSIERLGEALERLDMQPQRILAPLDQRSDVLARAVAAYLGVPMATLVEVEPGPGDLAVVYDLLELDDESYGVLAADRRVLLFAHATCWTEAYPIAADFTTVLYQYHEPAWDEDEDALAAEIAAEIITSPPDLDVVGDRQDLQKLMALCGAIADEGVLGADGPRDRAWAGSPVASSRFA